MIVSGLHITLKVPLLVCAFVGPNGSGKTTNNEKALGFNHTYNWPRHILGEPIEHQIKYLSRVGAMIEGQLFIPHFLDMKT